MVKIFRKARKRMLDKNRLKYLKYAIGEIALVVIGILIALGVNNWNNQRQEVNTLKGYLQNVAKNIRADKEQLVTITSFRENSMVSSRYFMDMSAESEISKSSLKTYVTEHMKFMPLFDESFSANLNAFEALKNSGYLSRLKGIDLENYLYEYYGLVDKISLEESSLNNFMEEMEYDMYKNNVVLEFRRLIKVIMSNRGTVEDLDKVKKILNYPSFIGANSRNVNVDYLTEYYRDLQRTGDIVLKKIELF